MKTINPGYSSFFFFFFNFYYNYYYYARKCIVAVIRVLRPCKTRENGILQCTETETFRFGADLAKRSVFYFFYFLFFCCLNRNEPFTNNWYYCENYYYFFFQWNRCKRLAYGISAESKPLIFFVLLWNILVYCTYEKISGEPMDNFFFFFIRITIKTKGIIDVFIYIYTHKDKR